MAEAAPWLDLLARAERERDLAAEGRWDELVEAGAERAAIALTLPAPPEAARPALERLARVQEELTAVIVSARAATARELGGVHNGRDAMRGYGPAKARRGGWIDESS